MTSTEYINNAKEIKKGNWEYKYKMLKAWPEVSMTATENNDQLLSVSIKDQLSWVQNASTKDLG